MSRNEREEEQVPPDLAEALRGITPEIPSHPEYWKAYSQDVRAAFLGAAKAKQRARRRWTGAILAAAAVAAVALGMRQAPRHPTRVHAPAAFPEIAGDVEMMDEVELRVAFDMLSPPEGEDDSADDYPTATPLDTVEELSAAELQAVLTELQQGA
ncbi:MAG: hypothetical protein HY698_12650 [Deltaproteobacteria bacterium]|nr:hypothetical protein [Deltaproteobacteria bacterium]